ncbi:MAG: leucyl/phenylalanyl-tRNA--protein transferase, partial [Verrucomicrobiota bacterium]
MFPWYSEGEPVQWWCPDPRFVLRPEDARISDS